MRQPDLRRAFLIEGLEPGAAVEQLCRDMAFAAGALEGGMFGATPLWFDKLTTKATGGLYS